MQKLKVLYDHQTFSFQKTGGISRYFFELLKAVSRSGSAEAELALMDSPNLYLKSPELALVRMPPLWSKTESKVSILNRIKEQVKNFPLFRIKALRNILKKANPVFTLAEENRKISLQAVAAQDFDVFHPTYYDDYFLSSLGNKPLVVTVHDMIHELFHGEFPEYRNDDLKNKAALAKRADRIIAISENTKKDLMKLLNIPEEKITVIHHGPPVLGTGQKEYPGLPEEFVLFVGDRLAYKNFGNLAEAFQKVLKTKPECRLITLGGGNYSPEEKALLETLGLDKAVRHLSWVSDEELSYIYSKASVFCFPSLYEGFGFPVLEAFDRGCPVAVSRGSSFPEVAGEGAEYFDPRNPEDMAEALLRILTSEDRRNDLIRKGKQQLKKFSWETCSEKTMEVYRAAVQEKKGK